MPETITSSEAQYAYDIVARRFVRRWVPVCRAARRNGSGPP